MDHSVHNKLVSFILCLYIYLISFKKDLSVLFLLIRTVRLQGGFRIFY